MKVKTLFSASCSILYRGVFLLLLSGMSIAVQAIPACQRAIVYTQPDGIPITLILTGDEHQHCHRTVDGVAVVRGDDGFFRYLDNRFGVKAGNLIAHDPWRRATQEVEYVNELKLSGMSEPLMSPGMKTASARQSRSLGFPNHGEVRGLIIMAQYADVAFSAKGTRDAFHAQMNAEGYSIDGATGSARDYFIDQSGGVFLPTFDVVGPVTLPRGMRYYGENDFYGNDVNIAALIMDACNVAHETCGVDFSRYDYDDDGCVDLVYVIYAGYAESNNASAETVWPSAGSLDELGETLTLDGKRISTFACSSELSGTSGERLSGIGTFCHEFSHCLGLPDLYNTAYGDTFGMGSWSIMDMGSYNNDSRTPAGYSAFERYSCGWLTLEELSTAMPDVALPPINESNRAYVIRSPYNSNEYFTLENRQQTGWDAHLPGHGLMIVHIDYDKEAWDSNTVNNTVGHERVQLVAADGDFTNPEGDLYPGTSFNTAFTDVSFPAARLYHGGELGKPVIEIREEGGDIFFHFMIDPLAAPSGLDATPVENGSFTATWDDGGDADSYTLVWAEQYTDGTVLANETFEAFADGTFLMPDTVDISNDLDTYTHEAGWTGSGIGQCGGRCYVKARGHITTPLLDFSGSGTFTLEFDAQSSRSYYDGIKITVSETADFSGRNTSFTLDSPSRTQRISHTFDVALDSGYVRIGTVSSLAISNLTLFSGDRTDVPRTEMTRRNPPVLIDGIIDNQCTINVTDWRQGYIFRVMSKNQYTSSPWSSKFKVGSVLPVGAVSVPAKFVSIDGDVMSIHGNPGDKVTVITVGGQIVIACVMHEPPLQLHLPSGAYVVRIGESSHKVMIVSTL